MNYEEFLEKRDVTPQAAGSVDAEESVQVGPFKPLTIDMSAMPGGVYALIVNGQRFTVVKK